MFTVKNNDTNRIEFKGAIEGFRILSQISKNASGVPVAADYRQVEIEWYADSSPVFVGNLLEFCTYMFERMGLKDERQLYLKQLRGKYLGASENKVIADLSVDFRSFDAHHVFNVRMRNVFTETTLQSFILFDFDKADEPHEERFRIVKETVLRGSVKEMNVSGFTTTVVFADNLGTFGEIDQTPIRFLTVSDKYYSAKFTGVELLVLQDFDKGELRIRDYDGTFKDVAGQFLATRLSDREVMENPSFFLELDESKMATTGAWTITYDIIG